MASPSVKLYGADGLLERETVLASERLIAAVKNRVPDVKVVTADPLDVGVDMTIGILFKNGVNRYAVRLGPDAITLSDGTWAVYADGVAKKLTK